MKKFFSTLIVLAVIFENETNYIYLGGVIQIIIFGIIIGVVLLVAKKIIISLIHKKSSSNELEKLEHEYDEEYQAYLKKKEIKQKDFELEFEKTKKEINEKIKLLNKELTSLTKKQKEAKKELDEAIKEQKSVAPSIHNDYLKEEIILLFQNYLQKGRCDTLKECINLYEQEKAYMNFQEKVDSVKEYTKLEAKKNRDRFNQIQAENENNLKEVYGRIVENEQNIDMLRENVEEIDVEQKALSMRSSDNRIKYGGIEAEREYQEELDRYKEKVKDNK